MKSATDSVETPSYLLDYVRTTWGEFYDPCPLIQGWDAKLHSDGLVGDWDEGTCFVNPPFSKTKAFFIKAHEQWKKGRTVVLLVKGTIIKSRYFQQYAKGAELNFLKGKVTFPGYTMGAWFPVMFVVFYAGRESNEFKCITISK